MVICHVDNLTLTTIFSGIFTVIGFKGQIHIQGVMEISVGRKIEMVYLNLKNFIWHLEHNLFINVEQINNTFPEHRKLL